MENDMTPNGSPTSHEMSGGYFFGQLKGTLAELEFQQINENNARHISSEPSLFLTLLLHLLTPKP